ncbi:hypothetical protein FM076_23205 [Streptomyces albus subsp. chlorinus]|uniref:hypothetical protein n=1 Tax=Streptomyces albus TaxID=1888 RepID=UPI001570E6AF|nr:hypothetical protein [Streptomyces albus]NSC23900.1 hypothetical protein [Streptomyces albus subsp. chlorinus]
MRKSGTARHKAPASCAPRVLARAGVLAAALGAALGTAVPAAGAAEQGGEGKPGQDVAATALTRGLEKPVQETARGAGVALGHTLKTVSDIQLDPLANTGSDPLDNSVGTQIADFRPISTAALTGPLASGASLGELPVVGPVLTRATGVLPH